MFIATKFLDVEPISIKDFAKKVAHKKYSVEQIKEKVN